jgi:lysozyme
VNDITEAALRAELLTDEGHVLKVYDDATGKPIGRDTLVKGNPSIGVGRNLSGNGITSAESDYLLANDMDSAEGELLATLPWVSALSTGRQVVMFSLHFNMSLHNVAHFLNGWPHFIGQMQAGQYEQAAHNLETTEPWASQVGARAPRLAALVRAG